MEDRFTPHKTTLRESAKVRPDDREMDNPKQAAADHREKSVAIGRQSALEELAEIQGWDSKPNWDGEGAEPISIATLRIVRKFIEAMPDGLPLPHISPEPDGQIQLEWHKQPDRILSLSIGPDATIYWAALFGSEDPRGSCPFFDEIPETIRIWIQRVTSA